MNNLFIKKNLYNLITNLSIIFLLLLFFYKINFETFIPVSGDELNSILVYSSNVKTVFLKNFPGNVTFFHLLGYFKTLLFGYDLISYRAITFIFLIFHFWILKKMKYGNNIIIFFFTLILLSSSFPYYAGIYVGYIFSSLIYFFIFYLIKINLNERHTKLILFLLFIQIYNHLVNLYLVVPIIFALFIFSDKKKFIKSFLFYYLLPVIIFYTVSIILTGLSVLKVSNVNLSFILFFLIENYQNVLINGFNRIFFYEAYMSAEKFNIIKIINDFFVFDKMIFTLFVTSLVITIFNFTKNKNKIFSLIIFFHVLTFFLIYKNPAPRIFVGFYCFYIFLFLDFIYNNKILITIIDNKYFFWIFLIILIYQLISFDYLKNIPHDDYQDFNFFEDKISNNLLSKKCELINKDFSEMQKRNFYFNYINLCNHKFNLTEFLNFYRS